MDVMFVALTVTLCQGSLQRGIVRLLWMRDYRRAVKIPGHLNPL